MAHAKSVIGGRSSASGKAVSAKPPAASPTPPLPRASRPRWRGEFFSLGGLLASFTPTRLTMTPWAISAALLAMLSAWDPIAREGEFDAILLGLAGYELLIGLTADRRHQSGAHAGSPAVPDTPAS